MNDVILVSEWDAETFQHRVLELEQQGYVVQLETYRVTPEMNPETGQIIHLRTVELYHPASHKSEDENEGEDHISAEPG